MSELAKKGGTVLFVGTKKQAQEAVLRGGEPLRHAVRERPLARGMLTNFVTIRSRVTRMEELEAMEADGRMAVLPKKEQILLRKELSKLQTNLNGIRNMKRTPDAVFVIDTNREAIAIHAIRISIIPVVGTLDTNCDPDDVDYGIPANDDAIRSVRLLADFVADAVVAGVGAPGDGLPRWRARLLPLKPPPRGSCRCRGARRSGGRRGPCCGCRVAVLPTERTRRRPGGAPTPRAASRRASREKGTTWLTSLLPWSRSFAR